MLSKASPELLAGRVGRWRWPWLLLGHVTAIAVFFVLTLALAFFDEWLETTIGRPLDTNTILSSDRPESFLYYSFIAVVLIVPATIVIKLIHGQKLRAAIGPDGRFSLPNFVKAAAAVILIYAIILVITVIRYPENFIDRGHGIDHAPWLLLAAAIILLTAFAEDLFFKGYLLRSWGAVLPIRSIVIVLAAATFTSLHALNPDVKADLWFMLIVLFAADIVAISIYLRTASLAAVTGMHWMNNVWGLILIAQSPGYDNPLALIEYKDPILAAGKSHLTELESCLTVAIGLTLLWVMLIWRRSPLCLPKANRNPTH